MHKSTILLFAATVCLTVSPAIGQLSLDDSLSGGGLFDSGQGQEKQVLSVSGEFTVSPDGRQGEMFVTAKIEPGWHIYSITQPEGGPIATRINLELPQGVRLADKFQPSVAPGKKKEPAFDNIMVETHHGTIVWRAPLEFGAGVDPSSLQIAGTLMVQPCDANSCLPPRDLPFTAVITTTPPIAAINPANALSGATGGFDLDSLKIDENDQINQTATWLIILMAFAGGLILNIMPCVLPVIGLKLLSFIEQSGHRRGHALMLNVWYSAGLISVFLVLATLAVTLGFGWGQLFSLSGFNIALAAVVFTMGLSFLGVWEIPIPGFAGRGRFMEIAEKEGVGGAFSKGVLTTVLATPCSAPFLAPALTWAVAQPPGLTYAVFAATGLGMASPYLLIGAFPKLIGFLPKPGAWMDTFKEVMGFVLLGTVVFLLSFMAWPLVVPTVGFLFGLWASCWWIGRISPTADFTVKLREWLTAAAFAGLVWLVTFGWLSGIMESRFERAIGESVASAPSDGDGEIELPWQPFTPEVLKNELAAGSTVIVDFTADWCLTCKTLESFVLNTREIHEFVEANRIVTLHADWTHSQPEVTKMLERLGSKQVPVLAIFPAADPNHPIVLRGGYTKQNLLDELEKAVSVSAKLR